MNIKNVIALLLTIAIAAFAFISSIGSAECSDNAFAAIRTLNISTTLSTTTSSSTMIVDYVVFDSDNYFIAAMDANSAAFYAWDCHNAVNFYTLLNAIVATQSSDCLYLNYVSNAYYLSTNTSDMIYLGGTISLLAMNAAIQ